MRAPFVLVGGGDAFGFCVRAARAFEVDVARAMNG